MKWIEKEIIYITVDRLVNLLENNVLASES